VKVTRRFRGTCPLHNLRVAEAAQEISVKEVVTTCFGTGILLGSLISPEGRDDAFLRNVVLQDLFDDWVVTLFGLSILGRRMTMTTLPDDHNDFERKSWLSQFLNRSVSETLYFLAFRIPDDGQSPETQ
jgi:hypothetical protein